MGKRKAPWWLRILKALGWLVGIGLLVVFGPALIPHRADVETIPDPRRTVPDAQNAVVGVVAAAQKLSSEAGLTVYPVPEPSKHPIVLAYLNANAAVLDDLDRALRRPDAAWSRYDPWSTSREQFDAGAAVRKCARLIVQRGYLKVEQGDLAGGMRDFIAVADLGRRLGDAGGALTDYFVGVAVEAIGLSGVRGALGSPPGLDPATHDPTRSWPHPGLRPAQRAALRDTLRRLDGWVNEPAACQHTLAIEYYRFKDNTLPPPGKKSASGLPGRATLFYQPRKTIRLEREMITEAIRQAGLPPGQRDRTRFELAKPHGLGWIDNPTGRILVSILMPVIPMVAERADHRRAAVVLTRVCIALRLYLEDHGRLPKSLAELAPVYLKEPPLDPYDGKLVRYVPARAMVYCVGPNGKDEGGARGGVSGGAAGAGKGPDDQRTFIPFLAPPGSKVAP